MTFSLLSAQDSNSYFVFVEQIIIEGNKRTKSSIIKREVRLKEGQMIHINDLTKNLEKIKQRIINLNLFNDVVVNIKNWNGDKLSLNIVVKERWYMFPFPVFELIDRNFNVWWKEYNHDFSRTVYGIKFLQENLTGRRDDLRITALFGYGRKFEVEYEVPFLNSEKGIGLQLSALYKDNKEIPLNSLENKNVFVAHEDFASRRLRLGLGINIAPTLVNKQSIDVFYHQNHLNEDLLVQNNSYYSENNNKQRYIEIRYKYVNNRTDWHAYPLNGTLSSITLAKEGLGIFKDFNQFQIQGSHHQFKQLSDKWFLEGSLSVQQIFTKKYAFFNNQYLNYDDDFDYIRGYEYYTFDVGGFALTKANVKYRILNTKINAEKFIPIKQFQVIPIQLYLKLVADGAYTWNGYRADSNTLNEKWLYSYGIGLDFVSFYDTVLRFSYTINGMGEKGLYLHYELIF